jgi:hypothetical protein
MSPLRLTDAELDAVLTAAQPIPPNRRGAFLQHMADALRGCAEVGSGTVHRVVAKITLADHLQNCRHRLSCPHARGGTAPRSVGCGQAAGMTALSINRRVSFATIYPPPRWWWLALRSTAQPVLAVPAPA